MDERLEQLAKTRLFGCLRPAAIELVASVAGEETYPVGARIFERGEIGDRLYVILEGKVRISLEMAGMGEESLALLGPGDAFGEMALLDESPRSAAARAHEACRLLTISKDHFDDLLFLNKELAYEVLWSMVRVLATCLRETTDRVTFLSAANRFE